MNIVTIIRIIATLANSIADIIDNGKLDGSNKVEPTEVEAIEQEFNNANRG